MKFRFIKTMLLLLPVIAFFTTSVVAQDVIERVKEREAELEQELTEVEKEVKELQEKKDEVAEGRKTLQGEISKINLEISGKENNIRQYNSSISRLSSNIKSGEIKIQSLEQKLSLQKDHLSQLHRRLNEVEGKSYFLSTLAKETLSEFVNEKEDQWSIQEAIQDSLNEISDIRNETEDTIVNLTDNRRDVEGLRQLEVIEKLEIEKQKQKKDDLLTVTKGLEDTYQQIIGDKEKEITRIRAELFELRGTDAISFGEALEFAFEVERLAGIRPAFLLGVIKIETELGSNLGTGNWRDDMHPVRDAPVFEVITDTLGLNKNELPVSRKPSYGWGGAMGPAQFIPSTWACYGGYVSKKTGSCGLGNTRFIINRSLKIGDTGNDVFRLQQFLNKHGFTIANSGDGSPGQENTYFGPATSRAVSRLQETYRSVLLEPDGLRSGTGSVGPRTQYFVNRFEFWTGGWRYDSSKDTIRKILGLTSPSNPWNPREAFIASGTYLEQLGGDGSESDECLAARKYLAGGNYNSNVAWGYCRTVQSFARDFQSRINFLSS